MSKLSTVQTFLTAQYQIHVKKPGTDICAHRQMMNARNTYELCKLHMYHRRPKFPPWKMLQSLRCGCLTWLLELRKVVAEKN